MITRRRRLVESFFRYTACLALAGMLAVVGCGNPGEGTVLVSPEARARLTPRLPATVKGSKSRLVGERPIGIKNRGVPGATTP
jgi:hypothetical protein